MDPLKLDVISPKRTRVADPGWEGFFPYYAGFPLPFAQRLLASAKLDSDAIVLDPWNGSGTTTYAAADAGLSSIGLDLNPVMVLVARARTLATSEADALNPLAKRIAGLARGPAPACEADDELLLWFDESTSRCLRELEVAIRDTLVGELAMPATGPNLDMLSAIAATQYVAMFRVLRILGAGFRTSNPTWTKRPRASDGRARADRAVIHRQFLAAVAGMSTALSARRSLLTQPPSFVEILNRDSADPIGYDQGVDLVLTSPPYCTRIDYVAATRLELALLQPLRERSTAELSAKMLGSTRAPRDAGDPQEQWGDTCQAFLKRVKSHSSKASSGYYYRTHLDYFSKLSASVCNVRKSLKDSGAAVFVVQDSYYKEVHNDLPGIVIEMCRLNGLALSRRENFQISRTMAGRHRYVKAYRDVATAVESVLCFEHT